MFDDFLQEQEPLSSRETPLSVSEFTDKIKRLIEDGFPEIWVRGEISNLRIQSSGHAYFSLKDADSQLPAAMFRGALSRSDVKLRDGLQVIVFGKVDVYEKRGAYQIIIKTVLEEGAGRLHAEFERLKAKLKAEGLFDKSTKREIPKIARTIAFVTSPTGAAIQDFISILKRRDWTGTLYVVPAKVQGVGAAEEIAQQIKVASRIKDLDLLVVGRGGGSLEDLWCFNEEIVARAVYATKIPVISAVGHETDFTLSDFVADRRAETPSAAAELISSNLMEVRERFESASEELDRITDDTLNDHAQALDFIEERMKTLSPENSLNIVKEKINGWENRLALALNSEISRRREEILRLAPRLESLSPENLLALTQEKLRGLEKRLTSTLTPLETMRVYMENLASRLSASGLESTLKRGFVIASDEETGKLISSSKGIGLGQNVLLRFHDGSTRVQGQDMN